MTVTEERLLPRRWAVLAALFIALVALQTTIILPGGCALEVMETYMIDPTLYAMVMSVPYFAGVIFGIISGTLADRIGMTKVIVTGYAIALIGAIWRYFSGDFVTLFISSFLMGMATAVLNANSAKVIRAWFPGKTANTAFGLYVMGASLGALIALQVGARIPMIQCWFISIFIIAVAIVAWLLLYRDHPDGIAVDEPISQHLGSVLKSRSVWGISLYAFFFLGACPTVTTFLIPGLQTVFGADPGTAANISTINTIAVLIACLVIPGFFARFKWMRGITWVFLIVTAVCYPLVFMVPYTNGVMPTVMTVIAAFAVGGIMAMAKSLPALLPDIPQKFLGAAGGVQSTFQNLGMFLVSSYIISPICLGIDPTAGGFYYQLTFVGYGVCCVIGGLMMFLYPNLRTNIPAMLADKAAAEGKVAE